MSFFHVTRDTFIANMDANVENSLSELKYMIAFHLVLMGRSFKYCSTSCNSFEGIDVNLGHYQPFLNKFNICNFSEFFYYY